MPIFSAPPSAFPEKKQSLAVGRPRWKLGRLVQEYALFYTVGVGDNELGFAFPIAASESQVRAVGRNYVIQNNVVSQFFRRAAKHRDSIKVPNGNGVFILLTK